MDYYGVTISTQAGRYELRLARSDSDVTAAQSLRYEVFCKEMGASKSQCSFDRDADLYDDHCHHLLVIDRENSVTPNRVVGTYRLLNRQDARQTGGFYSEQEFDLHRLLRQSEKVVEMGRSCVASDARSGAVIALLWRGIASYVLEHRVEYLFGCGSFPGTDVKSLGKSLNYLHHCHLAPASVCPRAHDAVYVDMKTDETLDSDTTLDSTELPPLLKGYLRAGSWVGDGAVIDHRFNTIDVCVVLDTRHLTAKYRNHFQR